MSIPSDASSNEEELFKFLETTLLTLDGVAGDVDEDARQKLEQLKRTLQENRMSSPLLSEASIVNELERLNDQMSGIERRIADADPLTKALLGTSAEILTKNPSPQSEKTPSKP